MWSKIYIVLLAVSLAVMGFFSYYSMSWLQSIGDPRAASAGFEYHSAIAWPVLWISSIALLVVANAVLWTSRHSWAIWVTAIYLIGFIVAKFFWLDRSLAYFQTAHSLAPSSISFGPFLAAIMIVIVVAIAFFDQFFAVKMYEKIYPTIADEPKSDLAQPET